MNGKPLWTKEIGVLDSGWFFDPDTSGDIRARRSSTTER